MMSQYTFDLESESSQTDIDAVEAGLVASIRRDMQGDASYDPEDMNIFIKSDDGTIVGGLLGASWWGWLYISVVWVHDDLQGKGFGTQLMQMAEDEASKRKCHSVVLDTHDFQALPFYQKLGYVIFGELEDFPPGHFRYYLKKRLQAQEEV